jgi:hypothetical protein
MMIAVAKALVDWLEGACLARKPINQRKDWSNP